MGNQTTASLADSLPVYLASARITREFEGVMPQLVEKQTLGEGVGLTWNEVTYTALTAQAITENTILDNPQSTTDSLFSITPTVVGIETFITDRTAARIFKAGYAKLGGLAQNAIQRKKDQDCLVVLDGATTSLCGAGNTLTSGHIGAAVARITSNATEPGNPPIRCVLHGYQIKDILDELLAGIGTYNVPDGLTARVFSEGYKGTIGGAQLYEDGNITIDASDDAKGGVFTQESIVMVQGRAPRAVSVRRENVGGGGTSLYHYDEYALGERSAGNWLYEIYSDATAPTS
jgi:hypothetical protein